MSATRHVYGDHPHQFADLYLPADHGGAPLPVAVVVHGGFWMTANGGADRMVGVCEDLAARGWAAWNVEYRRLGDGGGGGWPQTADDVARAIDHLAQLPDDVPLDLARVVSIGHSAGGHLTLLEAVREDAAVRVVAAVAQAPLTDVQLAHELGAGVPIIEAFMGGAPADRADEYTAASPVRRLPLGVPLLVVHGDADEMVPPAMVCDYVAAAKAAGDEVTFDLRPGEGHFDHLDPSSPAWAAAAQWLTTRFGAASPGAS